MQEFHRNKRPDKEEMGSPVRIWKAGKKGTEMELNTRSNIACICIHVPALVKNYDSKTWCAVGVEIT